MSQLEAIKVAPKEKFKLFASLPASFPIDTDTTARTIVSEDAPTFAVMIAKNPDISKYVTWAALVHGPDDVIPALQSRTQDTMLGRYALVRTSQNSIFGYLGIFPGKQNDEYGMGIFLDQSARGSGYAKKALAAMMDTAKVLSPKRMYMQVAPDNAPSIATAAELGFQPAEMVRDEELGLNEQKFILDMANG